MPIRIQILNLHAIQEHPQNPEKLKQKNDTPPNTHFPVFHARTQPHHWVLHEILMHFDVWNMSIRTTLTFLQLFLYLKSIVWFKYSVAHPPLGHTWGFTVKLTPRVGISPRSWPLGWGFHHEVDPWGGDFTVNSNFKWKCPRGGCATIYLNKTLEKSIFWYYAQSIQFQKLRVWKKNVLKCIFSHYGAFLPPLSNNLW